MYVPEIYPSSIRSGAVGVANIFSRIGGFTAPFVAELLFYSYGLTSVCIFLCCFYFSSALWATLLSVETKGRELYETIEDLTEHSSFEHSVSNESTNKQSPHL